MNRVVVNVSTTDFYIRNQARMLKEFSVIDPESKLRFWTSIPPGWPKHEDTPYAFKAHALMEASKSADLLLWCDSCIVPIRSLDSLWKQIEDDGYWIALNGWTNYEWTADSAYPDLFPERSLDDAREVNKTFPHAVATAFGLNVKSAIGRAFLDEYYHLSNTKAFCGPWRNTKETPCGPADVLGHRHDQTAASVIAWRLGMKLTPCPEVFSYPPGTDRTILVASAHA